ncbi:MAG: aminodeoxychorismate synthase, component I [Clostridiales bacterium GWC2_40_7]|nr:MAG: aminodeoxychorismate synthase, component I [Clostridiales bacterium GWC2_40_7]
MEIKLQELDNCMEPFEIYKIFKDDRNTAFLDSARDFQTLGRYSFIGVNPFLVLKEENSICHINGSLCQCDTFEKLDELLKEFHVEYPFEIPFPAGCIGYISYDAGLRLDKVNITSCKGFDIPDIYFVFYDNLILFDNLTGKRYVSACGRLTSFDESIALILARINSVEEYKKTACEYPDIRKEAIKKDSFSSFSQTNDSNASDSFNGFKSNFTRKDYEEAVTRMKKYIRSGDIYIANMTQCFLKITEKNSFDIYEMLRGINPAPFAAYLSFDGFEIISCSPERFMRMDNRMVETRPIKGTRPRGRTPQEDEENKNQLLQSEKDKAELLMIVDLERNDLSKVCKPGTVKVTELFKLEEYSTVFHLVSTVIGELRDGISALQCIKSCFPGGSITGTPKIRAMEIIDELEGIKRSLYTGCIGYFSFNGNADFNIVIRTLIKKGKEVCVGVGGGITWDSVESDEYMETLDKARAFFRI